MPKRTALLVVLFLIGCPKSSGSDAEGAGVFHFDEVPRLPARKSSVPIEVLAPKGRHIDARTLAVAGRIEERQATTELTIGLSEPAPSGARLSLLLPPAARVEKLRARAGERTFEATRDPSERSDRALAPVAMTEPRFAPELPPDTEEIVVVYREELAHSYRIPLIGLSTLDEFSAEVVTSTTVIRKQKQRWTPDRDLEVRLFAPRFEAPKGRPKPIDSLLVVLDGSASSAKDWERQIELARALVEGLGERKSVHIGMFDQTYQRAYEGPSEGIDATVWQNLRDRRALGASNYGLMLGTLVAGRQLRVVQGSFSRMLVIGDGVATTGNRDPNALGATVQKLAEIGVKRIDAIAIGDRRSEALLRLLVEASPAEKGAVIDGDLPIDRIALLLSHPASRSNEAKSAPASEPLAFFARDASGPAMPIAKEKPKLAPAPLPDHQRDALPATLAWYDRSPFNPRPIIALGEIFASLNDKTNGARAYGSLVDLHSDDPDMLQLAGMRMDGMREESAVKVALDAFDRAVALAPERVSSHRLFAWALMKAHQEPLAFAAIERALKQKLPGPAQRILREDAAILAAAWARKEPAKRQEIAARLIPFGMTIANQPSLTFALYWNAAIDVDLVIVDGNGNAVPIEVDLGGYGPELARIRAEPKKRAYPYRAEAHVYGRAQFGLTAGKLEIVEHDGSGGLRFSSRTFMLEVDGGTVDLGEVARPFGPSRGD